MARATRGKRIKVPDEAVRSREQILSDARLYHDRWVLVPCHNCGGSGYYPSSMVPPGRCRFYCWADATNDPFQPYRPKAAGDPTYGMRLVPVDKYVKDAQKADRAEYRAKVRADSAERERQQRVAAPDARAVALADAFGWTLEALPPSASRDSSDPAWFALSLLGHYLATGELSDKQWDFAAVLPERKREREDRAAAVAARKAASQHVGGVGERVRAVPATLEWFRSFGDNGWGPRTLFKFRAGDNLLVWWTSTWPAGLRAAPGDAPLAERLPLRVTLSGTVKRHTEYDGERQTELSRVTITD